MFVFQMNRTITKILSPMSLLTHLLTLGWSSMMLCKFYYFMLLRCVFPFLHIVVFRCIYMSDDIKLFNGEGKRKKNASKILVHTIIKIK